MAIAPPAAVSHHGMMTIGVGVYIASGRCHCAVGIATRRSEMTARVSRLRAFQRGYLTLSFRPFL